MKKKEEHEQVIMEGMLTEKDIFRKCMREIGRKGGLKNTPLQRKTRKENARKLNELKKERKRKNEG